MKIVNFDHLRSQFNKICANEFLNKQMNEFFDSEPEISYEDILRDLSLEELSGVTKFVLSLIYQKLREEENFGYCQRCLVTSMGENEYDVSACIIDTDDDHNNGVSWDATYWL